MKSRRNILMLCLVAILALLVTGVASAAQDSRPGDVLYPLRGAALQLQLALTQDPAERAALEVLLAYPRDDDNHDEMSATSTPQPHTPSPARTVEPTRTRWPSPTTLPSTATPDHDDDHGDDDIGDDDVDDVGDDDNGDDDVDDDDVGDDDNGDDDVDDDDVGDDDNGDDDVDDDDVGDDDNGDDDGED